MPFGMWGGVGDSHHVLDGCPDPPQEGAILVWERGRPIVKYRDNGALSPEEETAGSVEMGLRKWVAVGPRCPQSVYKGAWIFGATMRPFVKLL